MFEVTNDVDCFAYLNYKMKDYLTQKRAKCSLLASFILIRSKNLNPKLSKKLL